MKDETRTPPLRWPLFWRLLCAAYLGIIIWVSLKPSAPDLGAAHMDKLAHLAGYGGLMWCYAQCYARRQWSGIAIALIAMGLALEYFQGLGGIRSAEWLDGLANGLGVVLGWFAAKRLKWNVLQFIEAKL